MSYDCNRLIYLLTIKGWIHEAVTGPPDEAVETWEKEIYQGSEFGRESEHWRKLWSSPAFTKQECAELHEKFPFPGKLQITDDLFSNLR